MVSIHLNVKQIKIETKKNSFIITNICYAPMLHYDNYGDTDLYYSTVPTRNTNLYYSTVSQGNPDLYYSTLAQGNTKLKQCSLR